MLLFDWKKVFDTAAGSIYNCNLIMEMLVKGSIPKNKYDPYLYFLTEKLFRQLLSGTPRVSSVPFS